MTQKFLFVLVLSLTNAADPLCQNGNFSANTGICFPTNCTGQSPCSSHCCYGWYDAGNPGYDKDCSSNDSPCLIKRDPICQKFQKQNNNCFPNYCNLADTNNANLCSTTDEKCCSSYYTKDSTTGDAYFKDCRDHIAPCTIQHTDKFIMNNNCMDDSYTNIDMDQFAIAGVTDGIKNDLSIIKKIDTNDDIQSEIDSITSETGYIILQEGEYTITDTISLSKSNVVLRGIRKETTIIKVNFTSTAKYAIDIPSSVTYSGLEDITIQYIKLLPTEPKECPDGFGGCPTYPVYSLFYKNDYPNDFTGGIKISGDNCWLSNVEVNIIGKNPLYIPPSSEHVTITDCTFTRSYNKDGGKGYVDLRGGNILYKNNIATKLRHFAITRDKAKYIVVYNNYFEIDVNFHTKDAGYNLIENNKISTPRWHKWTGQFVTGGPAWNHWPPGPYNIIYKVTGEPRNGYNDNIFEDGKIYTYDYSIDVTTNITDVCIPLSLTVKQCSEQGYIPAKYGPPAATALEEPICKTFYPIIQLPKEIIKESENSTSWSFEYPLGEICDKDTWIREFEIDIIAKPDSRNDSNSSLILFFGTSSQCFIIVIDYDDDEKIIIAPANNNNLKSISGTIDTSIVPVKTSTEYGTLAEISDNMSSNKSPIKLKVDTTRTDTNDSTIGSTTVTLTKNGVSKSVTYTNTFDKNKNLYLYLSTYQNHKFQLDNIEDTTTTCQSSPSAHKIEIFKHIENKLNIIQNELTDNNGWSLNTNIMFGLLFILIVLVLNVFVFVCSLFFFSKKGNDYVKVDNTDVSIADV